MSNSRDFWETLGLITVAAVGVAVVAVEGDKSQHERLHRLRRERRRADSARRERQERMGSRDDGRISFSEAGDMIDTLADAGWDHKRIRLIKMR